MNCHVSDDLDRTDTLGIAESALFGAERFQSSTLRYSPAPA